MSKRPNVLVITSHDTGRHLGCYGIEQVQSPEIDALAADGVKLNKHYAAVPICSASRASMMTGQYPQTHGLLDLTGFGWALKNPQHHISHIMNAAGYRSCLFGQQHEVRNLDDLGYETPEPACAGIKKAEEILESLGAFLSSDAAKEKPFFASVGLFETHTPFSHGGATPDDSKGVFVPPYLADDDTTRRTCAALQGAVRRLDGIVGNVAQMLRENGLEEDTIFIYTTDHGVELPRAKWFCYDPGIEIAMIVRWPEGGMVGGKAVNHLTSNVDFLPTLLELLGIAVPAQVEGTSFAGSLRDPQNAAPTRDAVYSLYHKNMSRSVRTDRYKLIRYFDTATDFSRVPVQIEHMLAKRVIKQVELFDLDSDPVETKNLAYQPEYADVQRELEAKLWRWLERVDEPLLKGPISTPLYQESVGSYHAWRADGE